MMFQIPVQIGNMPMQVVFTNNGVAFVAHPSMVEIIEVGKEVKACFYKDGFTIANNEEDVVEYTYGTIYNVDQEPLMKRWLIRQNIQKPHLF